MQKSTKLILKALGSIYEYLNSFDPLDVKTEYPRCVVNVRQTSLECPGSWQLEMNFETREFFFVEYHQEDGKTVHTSYRLMYTDKEIEMFDEESYRDFLSAAFSFIKCWDTLYHSCVDNAYKRKREQADYIINTLENFHA